MANNTTALSTAEKNALSVSYNVLGTKVELDLPFVKKYLVRGSAEMVSDQEIVFFMNLCKMQKLNPLVGSEVYLIKYSKSDPAQVVVGKNAYMRRAFEHPDYLSKEDGITVLRNGEVVQKEGTCMYPGEQLIGGWCRVHYKRDGKERTAFKEVSYEEYNKGQANWKTKPATMVNKVAISQCVRDAFPKDYDGMYSEEEMIASGAIPTTYEVVDEKTGEVVEVVDDQIVTQEERQELLSLIQEKFGPDKNVCNGVYKRVIGELGLKSLSNMTVGELRLAKQKVEDWANEVPAEAVEDEQSSDEE